MEENENDFDFYSPANNARKEDAVIWPILILIVLMACLVVWDIFFKD